MLPKHRAPSPLPVLAGVPPAVTLALQDTAEPQTLPVTHAVV